MKSLSKNTLEVNEPISYFELNVLERKSDNSDAREKHAIKFDMNRTEVSSILSQLDNIQEAYDKLITSTT
jgi:hypothetical protein